MILSGKEIARHIGEEIVITPFNPKRLNPNSYNLTLADELMVYDNYELDMKKKNTGHLLKIPQEGYVLEPNKLYLGRTHEYTKTTCFVPMLEGRSSVGRLGLFIHVTAGFGGCRIFRLLDTGNVLCPADPYLLGCRNLPDLFPYGVGRGGEIYKRQVPE